MSDKAKGRVWELDLPHNEKWVLLAMADHADHEGNNMYPGHALIAYKTDLNPDTVQRIVRRLLNRGILALPFPLMRPSPSNPYHIDWSMCHFKPKYERPTRGRPKSSDPTSDHYPSKKRTDAKSDHYSKSSDPTPLMIRLSEVNDPTPGDNDPTLARLRSALNHLTSKEPLEPSRTPAGAPASARAREGDVDEEIIKYGNGNKKEGGKEGKKEREREERAGRPDLSRYVPCVRCKNVMVDPNTPPVLCDDCRRKQRGGGRDPIQMYPRLEKRGGGKDRP